MAAGRIQNRALLQVAGNDLNLEGIQRMPVNLNMDDVKVVYLLGGGMSDSVCSLVKYNGTTGEDIATQAAKSVPICGANYSNPLYGASLGMDAEIASLNVQVLYDGAGSTADAGTILGLEIVRNAKYGSLDEVFAVWLDEWQHVAANKNTYMWTLGNYVAHRPLSSDTRIVSGEMGSRIIPEGDDMEIYVYRPAGGSFPANTRLKVGMTVYTRVCQPQVAWDIGT